MFKSVVALYFQHGAENSIWAGRSLAHVLMDQELGIVSGGKGGGGDFFFWVNLQYVPCFTEMI